MRCFLKWLPITAAAVTTSATTGPVTVKPDSDRYRFLANLPWQPQFWAFGAVWTPLYVSIARATGNRCGGRPVTGAGAGARRQA